MSLSDLLPAALAPSTIAALCAVALVAGIARGFSGFGSALIFMPLASSLAAPRLVAPLLLLIDFVGALPMAPKAWRDANRPAIAVMALGALIGVPLGTWLLDRLDPVTTRWFISAFVFALLLLLLSGWRYRGPDHAGLSVGIGGVSGFCSGLAQTAGPPIVAYWLGRPIPPGEARANIVLFFAAVDGFSVLTYAIAGLITTDAIHLAVVTGPVYAAGIGIGSLLFGRADERLFRGVCYALIALAVIIGLPVLDGIIR